MARRVSKRNQSRSEHARFLAELEREFGVPMRARNDPENVDVHFPGDGWEAIEDAWLALDGEE